MKVLVTGASGFIGGHVIRALLAAGQDVIAADLNEERARSRDWYTAVRFIKCDLNEQLKDYYGYFNRPDLLIHLAWQGLPNYQQDFHLTRNLPVNKYFISNLAENGLKDIAVVGTCFEYGIQNGKLSEEMETRPDNAYARAKDELRKYLQQTAKERGLAYKWIRLFYLYGEGQNPNSLLPQLEQALKEGRSSFDLSGGEQERDYLPVEKAAEYIVKISLQNVYNGIFNCCSGQSIRIKDLVENYLMNCGHDIVLNYGAYPYPKHEPMSFWGDDSRLKKVLALYQE